MNTAGVQKFGGPWSLIKTDVIARYIKFFNTALKSQPFDRVYIDAFAGSGSFKFVDDGPQGFFPVPESELVHAGSARIALNVEPPFNRIRFIEKDKDNVAALQALIDSSGHPDATVIQGDANEELRRICHPPNWKSRRGVIFLDPFGMNVEWPTLKLIANTKALDLWFLFALAGTVRNLPRNAAKLDNGKRAAVTRILGTDEWFKEFYRPTYVHIISGEPVVTRSASIDDIEKYVQKRLQTIFPHVEPPKRIMAPGNRSLFSLFFAISNPSRVAVNLAKKGAAHILTNA